MSLQDSYKVIFNPVQIQKLLSSCVAKQWHVNVSQNSADTGRLGATLEQHSFILLLLPDADVSG